MASIQEMQKAKELMKGWLDLKTAVAQARTPVTPTSQINQDRLAQNQANRKANPVTPVTPTQPAPITPTPIQNAPVDQTTGLSKPLEPVAQPTPAPVVPAPVTAEVKPPEPVKTEVASAVTPKVEPVVDYTQAQWREQDIMTNLEKFKNQNMTPEQIKNASGYAQATPEKKAIIEWFLNPVKQDSGSIFNTLKMGGSVPATNTQEYRQAQARYNTFKKFSTYDVASLSTALQSGDLLMGTQAFTDLTSDPAMLAKIQRARAFSNWEVDIVKIWEKKTAYVMTNNPSVAQALADGNISEEEYNQLTNNAEVQTQAKVVWEKKDEYDKYKRQLEAIDDEVEAEYADKTVSDSFKSAIKANRDKAIRKLFNSASDEYQNAMGLYTELKNSSTALLAINMELYKTEQANKAEIAKEQRQLQFKKDLLQYKSDFEKQQAEQALNDPATQIKATMDEFEKMGITSQWSLASKIAEFKTSGLSLPEYVNNLRKLYMAKPEYQRIQAQEAGKGISYQTLWDFVYRQNADGSLTKTDISATKAKDSVREETPWEIVTIDWKSKERNKYTGETREISVTWSTTWTYNPKNDSITTLMLENGKPIKMLSEPANALATLINWNPDVKIDYNNLYREQADQYRLYGKGRTSEQLMKEGIPSLYADPTAKQVTWTTKSKHMTGTAVDLVNPTPDTIAKMNSAWFYQPADTMKMWDTGHFEYLGWRKDWKEWKQFTDSDIAILWSVTKLDKQWKSTLADNWLTERDLANFNAWLLPPTAKQKQESQTIVNKVDDILAWDWSDAVGIAKSMIFTGAWSDRKVTELKVQALKDLLAMANLDKIKGAMSDKDIEFLRNTATYLSTDLSETEFEKTLTEIKNKYANIAGWTPTTQPTETPSTPTNTGVWQTQQYKGYVIKPF